MKVLASGLDMNLEATYDEFGDLFGFGPCGAYSAARREQGWGDVAVCTAYGEDMECGFAHYIIVQDGAIIDLTNVLGEELRYEEIEILDADEMPELVSDEEMAWMRTALNA